MAKKCIILHQQRGWKDSYKVYDFYKNIFRDVYDESNIRLLCIDNSLDKESSKIIDGVEIKAIPSDNERREFSAWQAGFESVLSELMSGDFDLAISNETLVTHHDFGLKEQKVIKKKIVGAIQSTEKIMVGDLDLIPVSIKGTGLYSRGYCSTYFLFLNSHAVKVLSCITTHKYDGQFANVPNTDSVFLETSRIKNTSYGKFLEGWLYRENVGSRWYDFSPLNMTNYSKLKLKLHSILLEHELSSRLLEGGVKIRDIKYMSYDINFTMLKLLIKNLMVNYRII